jgi:hypothetical protein
MMGRVKARRAMGRALDEVCPHSIFIYLILLLTLPLLVPSPPPLLQQ